MRAIMKNLLFYTLYWIVVIILLLTYLFVLGGFLTYFYDFIGIPRAELIGFKKLVLAILALGLARFILFPIIGLFAGKIKKRFQSY